MVTAGDISFYTSISVITLYYSVIMATVQASRVTGACNKLLAAGPIIRGRPLQYVDWSEAHLKLIYTFFIMMNQIKYNTVQLEITKTMAVISYKCSSNKISSEGSTSFNR